MSFELDKKDSLNLKKMIKEYGAEDNTKKIRELKHSQLIKEQVTIMLEIKNKYARLDKSMLDKMINTKCRWLFLNYTNLFNKLKKEELNLQILWNLLFTLREIEEGKLDQHVASVKVGEILKKLYVDSAMRHKEKMEKKENRKKTAKRGQEKKISWNDFKKLKKEE
tara:strand:+ start:185 stop:682 length:498 start_codon:yes stop_codon:yes gene_type:complete